MAELFTNTVKCSIIIGVYLKRGMRWKSPQSARANAFILTVVTSGLPGQMGIPRHALRASVTIGCTLGGRNHVLKREVQGM